MMAQNDLQWKLLGDVRKDGMALAKIPDNLKTVDLCAAALRQCQDPKCFALVPKRIRKMAKIAAGCYNYHPPMGSSISSIYRKG
ncbi:MAG: hypothetical protein LBN21_05240 [Treponema sp.]|jgi:hypothetical protein|nr:hypothetical protein [Treponema sp.]